MQLLGNKDKINMPSSDQDSLSMNGSGTDSKSGTPLTQPGSGFDLENTRCDLIALRDKYGAESPIGHRCSNIDQLIGEFMRSGRTSLIPMIEKQRDELVELMK